MDTELLSLLLPSRWLRPSVRGAARTLAWFTHEKLPHNNAAIRTALDTQLRDALEQRGIQLSDASSDIEQLFTFSTEISDPNSQLELLRAQTASLRLDGYLIAATPLSLRDTVQRKAQIAALFLHAGLNHILQAEKSGYFVTAGRRHRLEP